MQSQFSFVIFYFSILISLAFHSFAASDGDYSWQPVQLDMRLRDGDYQSEVPNEDSCKTRCVQNPTCIGVDWYTAWASCFLLYDSNASPYYGREYRHWRIIRNRSTLSSSKGTVATTAATPATASRTATATTTATTSTVTTTAKTTTTTPTTPTTSTTTSKITSAITTTPTSKSTITARTTPKITTTTGTSAAATISTTTSTPTTSTTTSTTTSAITPTAPTSTSTTTATETTKTTTSGTTAPTTISPTAATTTPALTTTAVRSDIPIVMSDENVIAEMTFTRQKPVTTENDATLATPTTTARSATPIPEKTPFPEEPPSSGDPLITGECRPMSYCWKEKQINVHREGGTQLSITNEDECKQNCSRDTSCVGVDWNVNRTQCWILTSSAKQLSPSVDRVNHWAIERNLSCCCSSAENPLVGLVQPSVQPHLQISMICNSEDKLTTVVKVLSVLLCGATVVAIALLFNTCRLNRKIRNCACKVKNIDFTHQVQANAYHNNNYTPPNPSAAYLEMVGSVTTISRDSDNIYDAIDDVLRQ